MPAKQKSIIKPSTNDAKCEKKCYHARTDPGDNPASIPRPDLEELDIKLIDFPEVDYEGNDDYIVLDKHGSSMPDEDANPYLKFDATGGLADEIGKTLII